jgi:hypothetical protein
MMTRRTAISRHSRRANPHGTPAARLIAAHRPPARTAVADGTAPLLLPGLRPCAAR